MSLLRLAISGKGGSFRLVQTIERWSPNPTTRFSIAECLPTSGNCRVPKNTRRGASEHLPAESAHSANAEKALPSKQSLQFHKLPNRYYPQDCLIAHGLSLRGDTAILLL